MSFYDDASLIMYPSGYKADKIYSLKPTDGSGDFDFTRASSATRVNADGLIETVATGVPRIDYTGGGCGKLLLEPQRSNVITYSEDFSHFSWTKSNATISANTTISPDGTQNASTLVISASGYLLHQYTASVSAGGSWALSIFAKNQNTNFLRLGGATPSGTDTYLIQDMGNGWYRHFLTRTFASANASFNLQYLIGEVGTHYIYGAQLEEGSYPTSYIPTAGATATRVADVSSTTGLSSVINSPEGVLYVNMAQLSDDTSVIGSELSISDGTLNNDIRLISSPVTALNSIFIRIDVGGVRVVEIDYTGVTITDFNKIAIKWKTNDFALWINGVEVATDLVGVSFPALTLSKLATTNPVGGSVLNAKIQELMLFPTALSDTELATLTT